MTIAVLSPREKNFYFLPGTPHSPITPYPRRGSATGRGADKKAAPRTREGVYMQISRALKKRGTAGDKCTPGGPLYPYRISK